MSHIQSHGVDYFAPTASGEALAQYMSADFISLADTLTVQQGREVFLERVREDYFPAYVFIVSGPRLKGILSVKLLLQEKDGARPIAQLMTSNVIQARPEDSRQQIARLINTHDLTLIPVTLDGRLVGCLTEKEIAQLLAAEVTQDAQRQGATAPLETSYLDISPVTLWKKRVVWLLLLFVAEAYTSSVIQHFEDALESAIALAFFIPLLIGTGGNSGTQITSTLVRAMALGEVKLRDMGRVMRKEISTAMLIALTLGIAGYVRAWTMGIGGEITLIVSLTLVCVTLWSAVISSVMPMVIKRAGIDPAVVSAPFIATLIDGTGLIIYFKIAHYFLGIG